MTSERWAELRATVKCQRDTHYELACDHGEMPGHEKQEERAYGRVEAYDAVLAMMDEAAGGDTP